MDDFLKDQIQLKNYEKNLVAEQPGMITTVCGLTLALFIGVAIQAAISSEKILPLIDRAASNIDPRVNARVQSARISLANGIFPEIAVVVDGIHIESSESCWMRPVLEIDKLKLPLNLFKLINGQVAVKEIVANEASLSLRSDVSNCKKNESAAQGSTLNKVTNSDYFNEEKENFIEKIYIKKFQVHYLPVSFTSVLFKNFNVKVKNNMPKHLEFNGIVQISGETLSGDYNSSAYMNLSYNEAESVPVKGELTGNWREGNYSLGVEYNPTSTNYKFELDMNHIPANQMIPLLKKYKLLNNDLNGKQVWLSTKSEMNGRLNHFEESVAKFLLFRMEGNIGELEVRDVEFTKLNPIQHKPFVIEVKSLNFDQLLNFLNRPHANASIPQLGTFHGQINFKSENELSLSGEHTGLEIAFSSRGARQVQGVSYLHGDLKLLNKKWKLHVDKIKPAEGVFLGFVDLEADRNWDYVSIKSKVDDLTLGPAVQRALTDGGDLGPISGEIQFKYLNSEVQDLKGTISIPQLTLDGVLIKNSKIEIYTFGKEIHSNLKIQNAKLSTQSHSYKILKELLSDFSEEKNIEATSINIKGKSNAFRNFSWHDSSVQVLQNKIFLEGRWDENGTLEGKVEVNSRKGRSKFELAGHRDYPKFIKK